MQGCQLLKISWREEPKHEEKKYFNILQFVLRLRPSNCMSVLTLRKSYNQKKKKRKEEKAMFSLMREILHA